MDGGQSVSFASYDSNNYAGNLTFHEAELTGSQW